MLVFKISEGDENDLISKHKSIVINPKDLYNLIVKLKTKLRNDLKIISQKKGGSQITGDGFSGSLRKINLIFEEISKLKRDSKEYDKTEYLIESFFHYVKTFCEIFKKHFPTKSNKFQSEIKNITNIRNLFAHAYEKDGIIIGKKAFIRLEINNQEYLYNEEFISGIYELDICDFDKNKKIGNVLFSINIIYDSIIKMCKEILKK